MHISDNDLITKKQHLYSRFSGIESEWIRKSIENEYNPSGIISTSSGRCQPKDGYKPSSKRNVLTHFKLRLHTPIWVADLCHNGIARSMRGAWAEHEQKKAALRGVLHTPIYLAMTIATQIGDTNRCAWNIKYDRCHEVVNQVA